MRINNKCIRYNLPSKWQCWNPGIYNDNCVGKEDTDRGNIGMHTFEETLFAIVIIVNHG